MQTFIINPSGAASAKKIEDDLETFYREIGCRTIDITTRYINGRPYAIICDDEGLFCPDPIVTAVSPAGEPRLVGGLIIAKDGEDGELAGLDAEDVLRITNCVQWTIQRNGLRPVIMLDD